MTTSNFTYTKLYEQMHFDGFRFPLLLEARVVTGLGFPLSDPLPMVMVQGPSGFYRISFVEDLTDSLIAMAENPGSKPEYKTSLRGEFMLIATGTGYSIRLTVPHTGGDGHFGDFEFPFGEAFVERSTLVFTLFNGLPLGTPQQPPAPEIDWLKLNRRAACQ